MTPSLPIGLPPGTTFIEMADPIACGMLRFGLPCGNDAYFAFMCPLSSGCMRIIAVCHLCTEDTPEYNGRTWAMQVEQLIKQARQ